MRSKLAMMLGIAALGAMVGPISAQALEFDIGPGGVRVERGHRWDHRHYDRGECRTIIDHRVNRWGEDVTVRRRICD
jgi:hypothetical protein